MRFESDNTANSHRRLIGYTEEEREVFQSAFTDKICGDLAEDSKKLDDISDKDLELARFNKNTVRLTVQELTETRKALSDFEEKTDETVREQIRARAKHHHYSADWIPQRAFLGRLANQMVSEIYHEQFDMNLPDETDMPEAEFRLLPIATLNQLVRDRPDPQKQLQAGPQND